MTRTEAMSVTEKMFGQADTWSEIAVTYYRNLAAEGARQVSVKNDASDKIMSRSYPLNFGNDNDRISGI